MVARSSAVRSHLRCVVFFHFYSLLLDPNIRILLTDCWIRFRGPGQPAIMVKLLFLNVANAIDTRLFSCLEL